VQRRALHRRQTAYGKNSCLRSLGVRYVLEGVVQRDRPVIGGRDHSLMIISL